MAEEQREAIQGWTAKPRTALELSLVKGDISVMKAAQPYGLMVGEVEEWLKLLLLSGYLITQILHLSTTETIQLVRYHFFSSIMIRLLKIVNKAWVNLKRGIGMTVIYEMP